MTLKIALDSDALTGLLNYSDAIYEKVRRRHEIEIYIPVVVYAEQAIYPKSALPEILDVVPATVVPLTRDDADKLGAIWPDVLMAPMDRQKKQRLWHEHPMDCLIAAMALQNGWVVITNNAKHFCHFESVGLQFCSVADFTERYLDLNSIHGGA